MDTIANMMRTALAKFGGGQPTTAARPPAVEEQPFLAPQPFPGKFTYRTLRSYVTPTPEEEAASMAWEEGETNRQELLRALAAERRPFALELLQNEYNNLFGNREY